MSKKRTTYSSAFKTKLVLELLQNADTLAEIASKHNILPQNLVNWKKAFLANAEIAMEPSKAVKEYKEELIKSQEQNERLTALVGKVTVEKEWLAKKLKSEAPEATRAYSTGSTQDKYLSENIVVALLRLFSAFLQIQSISPINNYWLTFFKTLSHNSFVKSIFNSRIFDIFSKPSQI